jgi:predicted transcriptional regulator of viral defense system
MAQVTRRQDLAAQGLSSYQIGKLIDAGKLERVGWGLYAWSRGSTSAHRTLAEAAARVPHGVVCLLSALAFHGMGTEEPPQVWMAIHAKARQPRVDAPPLRFVRFSGAAWDYGVEHHSIAGIDVRITSPAKTVADCFKFRKKIGMDVALEALRAFLGRRGRSLRALLAAADACRVRGAMMPYIEAMT